MTDTSDEYITKVLNAAPFADNDAGIPEMCALIQALRAERNALKPVLKPIDEWHEDDGFVVWWAFPINEPSWIGTPNCSDWPGYHTHWTVHPAVPELETES